MIGDKLKAYHPLDLALPLALALALPLAAWVAASWSSWPSGAWRESSRPHCRPRCRWRGRWPCLRCSLRRERCCSLCCSFCVGLELSLFLVVGCWWLGGCQVFFDGTVVAGQRPKIFLFFLFVFFVFWFVILLGLDHEGVTDSIQPPADIGVGCGLCGKARA